MNAQLATRLINLVRGKSTTTPEERAEMDEALRAEVFWSDTAPKMADELRALRRLEAMARAAATHGELMGTERGAEILAVLRDVDATRNKESA